MAGEQKQPNNFERLEHLKKRNEQIFREISDVIQSEFEQLKGVNEKKFRFLAEIYKSVIQTFCRKFAGKGKYELGSVTYDTDESSMLITLSFENRKYETFLNWLKTRLNLIPQEIRQDVKLYVGEHDNFLEAPAVKIDENGFEKIEDSEQVPVHEEDILNYDEGEYEKIKGVGFALRSKLRELLELE